MTMSTEGAHTRNVRLTWFGNGLLGTMPPQIPEVAYLTATLGYPALREFPRLRRQGGPPIGARGKRREAEGGGGVGELASRSAI